MKFADICKQKRIICVMIALDISNAFNSLRWESIYEKFDRRKLPWKVKRLIGSNLSGRKIIVCNQHGTVEHEVAAGVPQGSILGLFLWNLVYDSLLERLANDSQHANGQSNRLRRRSGHHVFRREERRGLRQVQYDAKNCQRLVHECRAHIGERKDGSHAHH